MHHTSIYTITLFLIAQISLGWAAESPTQKYAGMLDDLQSEKAQANLLMKQINDTFHENIDNISYTLGKDIYPLIIVHSNSSHKDHGTFNYTLYKRDGSIETVPAHTSEETHIKYTVHHVPALLAIALPIFGDSENSTNPEWMDEFQQLDKKIVALSACLNQTDISPKIQTMLLELLNKSHSFIQSSLETKTLSEESFEGYTAGIKPIVMNILGAATSGFNERLSATFTRWQQEVGDKEWNKLQVIVQSSLALRKQDENPYLQPLMAFIGTTFRDDQIIITTNTSFSDKELRTELGHYFASKLVAAFVLPTHPGE